MSVDDAIKKAENQESTNVVKMPIPFTMTQSGTIKANSLRNIGLILEQDDVLKGTFAYNEFSFADEVIKSIPQLHIKCGYVEDNYISSILRYIEDKYGVLFTERLLHMAVSNDAQSNSYNPVKKYLEEAEKEWDGEQRVALLLPEFLGVEISEVTTLQTKIFFVGAVAKVFNPNSKFDYVLDLVGGQGVGKTTFLKKFQMVGIQTSSQTLRTRTAI